MPREINRPDIERRAEEFRRLGIAALGATFEQYLHQPDGLLVRALSRLRQWADAPPDVTRSYGAAPSRIRLN